MTTLTRPLTADELARLKQQQLAQQQKLGQVQAGQPVAGTSGSVAQIQHHAQAGQVSLIINWSMKLLIFIGIVVRLLDFS